MAGITLTEASDQLRVWLEASKAVASNQSYKIAGRELTRANAKEILQMLEFWDGKVKALTPGAGRGRARLAVPLS